MLFSGIWSEIENRWLQWNTQNAVHLLAKKKRVWDGHILKYDTIKKKIDVKSYFI